MSGWSARGSSRCGSLHHHSTQYRSRQGTKQDSPRGRWCELPAPTTPSSGFRRWRPAAPIPLRVQRPASAVASIAVRRRRLVSCSSIRRLRHPSGRADQPYRSCGARGAKPSCGPASPRASAPFRRCSRDCSGGGPAHYSPECCSLRCSVCGCLPRVTGVHKRRILARSHAPPMHTRQRVGRSAPGGPLSVGAFVHCPSHQPAAPGRATALGRPSATRRRSPSLQLVPPIRPTQALPQRPRRRRPPATNSPTSGSDGDLE